MKDIRILFSSVVLLAFNIQYAQQKDREEELSLDKGSISSQFEYLVKKSGNYSAGSVRYEVVKVSNLNKIQKNILDTISAINKKTSELKAIITINKSTIYTLNDKLKETTNKLYSVTEKKDSMLLLGRLVSKTSYNLILWAIITCLLVISLLLAYKFKKSNVLTKDIKTNLAELEEEYETHRKRTLEREQKISRKLQDEINKNKKTL